MGKYGEPWSTEGCGTILDWTGTGEVASWMGDVSDLKRALSCVNALAGIPDEHLPTIMQEVRDGLRKIAEWMESCDPQDPRSCEGRTLETAATLLAKLAPKEDGKCSG